jgi:hypothetical protein
VRAVIEGAIALPISDRSPAAAHGIVYGQYRAPIFEFIHPENRPGTAQVTNQYESFPFLVNGGSTSALSGTVVGQLSPWPGLVAPTPGNGACVSPAANAGGQYTVASGGTITLTGQVGGAATTPITVLWTASAGTLSNRAALVTQFTAPTVLAATTVNLALRLTNACGVSTSSAIVTVSAPTTPTAFVPVGGVTAVAGAVSSFALTGSDPDGRPLTFQLIGSDAASSAVVVTVQSTGATSATVSFTAPTLPVGSITPLQLNFQVTATNDAGVVSSPAAVLSVRVVAAPDSIALVTQYRTGKQRLIITAASSVVSPDVLLTLLPYPTAVAGVPFDPSLLGATFVTEGAGVHSLTLVGAPQPTVVQVRSNIGGLSPLTTIQRIRE